MSSPVVYFCFLDWLQRQEYVLQNWCDALTEEALADPHLTEPLARMTRHCQWLSLQIAATRADIDGVSGAA